MGITAKPVSLNIFRKRKDVQAHPYVNPWEKSLTSKPQSHVCDMEAIITPTPQGWQWHPTRVLLPGKSHGQRSLVGCSPWGLSDTTERLHFHFSLSCIGERNGNSLQCSCLENPRDGEAWWAAVSGVAQSRTRLKRLSSSSIELLHLWLQII